MRQGPYGIYLTPLKDPLIEFDHHIVRTLSDMRGQYADTGAYEALLCQGDQILYEVYEMRRPAQVGELSHGLSIIHPGKVGNEYFMTKGHFHAVIEAAEVYYCLQGEGLLLMETPEGDWAVEELRPGRAVYVPPRWAHRSINTGPNEDLITFFIYPSHAGHNYSTIEQRGFRKRIIERDGRPVIVDNPHWRAPGI